jgi:HD-like signal output (HDOD) protein
MDARKKIHQVPKNIVYKIDGGSYGSDEALNDAIKASIRKRLESKTLDIPRLPQVAGRILQLSNNPASTIDEVVDVIKMDPVLAPRVLSVANSAGYGSRVEGLKPALMRLGTKVVQDMVFAESIRLKIFSTRSYRSILEQSWKLSLGAAIACETLSEASGLERESAFLLGLLHETGKPVLVNSISEYEKQNNGRSLGQDMVEVLMMQLHEEIGAYVLGDWGMSPAIVSAAAEHHRYRSAQATPAQKLIYAGNLVCQHLGIGDIQRDIDFNIEHVFVDLGLTDVERIAAILDSVKEEVDKLMVGLPAAA